MASAGPDAALAEIVRAEAGLIVAALHRRIGDFDLAEEATQEAVVTALRTWREQGLPPNPGAWLTLTAQRRAVDLLRRSAHRRRTAESLAETLRDDDLDPAGIAQAPGDAADERLPMLFACCHPALRVEARLALMLRAVVGMTTPQLARAFLVGEPTMAQRLVRAKRKLSAGGVSFAVPTGADRAGRLNDVLTAILLAYNAGYLADDGDVLAGDAVWLAELVARSMPDEPEAWGLLSLLANLSGRAAARFRDGRLIPLSEQNRGRWDRLALARAEGYLERAASRRQPGRFQLQAAIAACHASAGRWQDTDWLQILTLYDLLLRHDRSPVVRLNHTIALSYVHGPEVALQALDAVGDRLAGYHLLHATRAQFLDRLGQREAAREANTQALALAENPAEQELLRLRIAQLDA